MQKHDKKLNLLLAIHCHQPVCNFLDIFQKAFDTAYVPFLDAFERFTSIKASFHFSGSLLDWLLERQPQYIKRLQSLLSEGRIELICGGYYEPILAIIPERDAIAQIALFRKKIKDVFKYDCEGVWLTERVWEPKLSKVLSQAGMRYTIVDDVHFESVGFNKDQLNGYYICEEDLHSVSVFPSCGRLRELIPFGEPEDAIAYLRYRLDTAPTDQVISLAEDGEKFGLWPETYRRVYEEGWLNNFFRVLDEQRHWIKTLTFSECLRQKAPSGRVYLPCSSYQEMQQWSRGYFKNFLVKYPEANNLQKRMFFISERLNEAEGQYGSRSREFLNAQRHLFKGQFNDAYWHGMFGGLYSMHLRAGAYENLIKTENIVDTLLHETEGLQQYDFDKDGKEEVIVSNRRMRLYLRPQEGATISEWDDKLRNLNLVNTLARRFEPYHEGLVQKVPVAAGEGVLMEPAAVYRPVKDKNLQQSLHYDCYPRYSLRDYFLEPGINEDSFFRNAYREKGKISNAFFEVANKVDQRKKIVEFVSKDIIEMCVVRLKKKVSVIDNVISVEYSLDNFGTKRLSFVFGTEFNLSIFDALLSHEAGSHAAATSLAVHDVWSGASVTFSLSPQARVWHFPVQTVSDSDSGIERTYQELCLFFHWPLTLIKGATMKYKLEARLV